ncbi:MAG: polysaccharide biosynthesis tyrosine autokinase [Planctomycetales bacterium]
MMQDPMANQEARPTSALIRATHASESAAPLMLQLSSPDERVRGGFSLAMVWHALLQRMKVGIPVGLLLALVACLTFMYVVKDEYKSLSMLRIYDSKQFIAFRENEGSGGGGNYGETQTQMLRSPFIIGRALETESLSQLSEIKDVEVSEDPVAWIGKRLKVMRLGKSELYQVSCVMATPDAAQKVVAAIVDVYMRNHVTESDTKRLKVMEVLKELQRFREEDIEAKRDRLKILTKQNGGEDGGLAAETGSLRAPRIDMRGSVLVNLQTKLNQAEVDLHLESARLSALKDDVETGSVNASDEVVAQLVGADPEFVQLQSQVDSEKAALGALNPQHKIAIAKAEKIAKLERDMAVLREKLRPLVRAKVEESMAGQQRHAYANAERNVDGLKRLVELLNERVDEERKKQISQGTTGLELEFARFELQNSQTVYKKIVDRIAELNTESQALGQVLVVQRATVPEFPDTKNRPKIIAGIGIATFFLPLLLLVGWDVYHQRVFDRDQLLREVDLKFVNEVASLPTRPVLPKLGSNKRYRQQALLFEESVNSLRTTMSVDRRLEGCQVFGMASAVSGEGKTNLSSQLAMSWSHSEPGKVIIIDGDLRKPSLHELFEVDQRPGLAEVLRGECKLEDAIVMDWGDRLYILPAGDTRSSSPSQLISGAKMEEVLSKLRSQYSKVVVDMPPVLVASEALLMSKLCDAVLLCALCDYSRAGHIRQAYDRLNNAGVNVVGAVLSGTPVRQYAYAYRGYGPT